MSKTKLTLTINQELLAEMKDFASQKEESLSAMVERFFQRMLLQEQKIKKDNWVANMDMLLKNMWEKDKLSPAAISQEITRDHDDFEQQLIEDLSKEFLP